MLLFRYVILPLFVALLLAVLGTYVAMHASINFELWNPFGGETKESPSNTARVSNGEEKRVSKPSSHPSQKKDCTNCVDPSVPYWGSPQNESHVSTAKFRYIAPGLLEIENFDMTLLSSPTPYKAPEGSVLNCLSPGCPGVVAR